MEVIVWLDLHGFIKIYLQKIRRKIKDSKLFISTISEANRNEIEQVRKTKHKGRLRREAHVSAEPPQCITIVLIPHTARPHEQFKRLHAFPQWQWFLNQKPIEHNKMQLSDVQGTLPVLR